MTGRTVPGFLWGKIFEKIFPHALFRNFYSSLYIGDIIIYRLAIYRLAPRSFREQKRNRFSRRVMAEKSVGKPE